MAFTSFEHLLLKKMRQDGMQGQSILVACSGGVDSVVLLGTLNQLSKPLGIKIRAIHIHHGRSEIGDVQDFRDRAQKLVFDFCCKLQIPLEIRGYSENQELKSEGDFRLFRYKNIEHIRGENEWVATAHHLEDLLETRLLRLIRGTGIHGLTAMSNKKFPLYRPFLEFSKKQLIDQMEEREWEFVSDPSNEKCDYKRNWIRNHWLPRLEQHMPGATKRLGLSLQKICQEMQIKEGTHFAGESKDKTMLISRSEFNQSSREQKKQQLVQLMRRLKLKNYSQNHIDEVIKRLDGSKKKHTFSLLGCEWCVDASSISVHPR